MWKNKIIYNLHEKITRRIFTTKMRILYIFYGHFNALFGLYSFIFIYFAKIIVALDS